MSEPPKVIYAFAADPDVMYVHEPLHEEKPNRIVWCCKAHHQAHDLNELQDLKDRFESIQRKMKEGDDADPA